MAQTMIMAGGLNRRDSYAIGALLTALALAALAVIVQHHHTPLLQATALGNI